MDLSTDLESQRPCWAGGRLNGSILPVESDSQRVANVNIQLRSITRPSRPLPILRCRQVYPVWASFLQIRVEPQKAPAKRRFQYKWVAFAGVCQINRRGDSFLARVLNGSEPESPSDIGFGVPCIPMVSCRIPCGWLSSEPFY